MKAKKILYLIAGILKIAASSVVLLFGILFLLLGQLFRSVLKASYSIVEQTIKELIATDASYSYLESYTQEQAIEFIMKYVNIMAIFAILIGLIWLAFGIINVLLFKRPQNLTKKKGIWLLIGTWILTFINISNILTTIAIFLKEKRKKLDVDDKYTNIETFNVS